jgi:hypothetical protein
LCISNTKEPEVIQGNIVLENISYQRYELIIQVEFEGKTYKKVLTTNFHLGPYDSLIIREVLIPFGEGDDEWQQI